MHFSLAQFLPLVGSSFTVHTSHGPFALRLIEAFEAPRRGLPAQLRTPLSLIFDGPAGAELAHDDYRVAHPALGEHVLNIVPILPGPGGRPGAPRYQILFS